MRISQTKTFSRLKPALRPAIRYRRELQGAIIFDPASLGVYATNQTGLMILKEINGRTSCAGIVERLRSHFVSTSRRTLRRDVCRFLEDLASVGLVDLKVSATSHAASRNLSASRLSFRHSRNQRCAHDERGGVVRASAK
jgi:hypothetical protein